MPRNNSPSIADIFEGSAETYAVGLSRGLRYA
jgi:hypothetical protein